MLSETAIQNAEETTEKPIKKIRGRPFQKGHPGGPGRPKGSLSLVEALKQRLAHLSEDKKRIVLEVLADQIVADALLRGTSDANRKLILNYLEGMPSQPLEHFGKIDLPFKIIIEPPHDNSNILPGAGETS